MTILEKPWDLQPPTENSSTSHPKRRDSDAKTLSLAELQKRRLTKKPKYQDVLRRILADIRRQILLASNTTPLVDIDGPRGFALAFKHAFAPAFLHDQMAVLPNGQVKPRCLLKIIREETNPEGDACMTYQEHETYVYAAIDPIPAGDKPNVAIYVGAITQKDWDEYFSVGMQLLST